jgi:hypothetical protein
MKTKMEYYQTWKVAAAAGAAIAPVAAGAARAAGAAASAAQSSVSPPQSSLAGTGISGLQTHDVNYKGEVLIFLNLSRGRFQIYF